MNDLMSQWYSERVCHQDNPNKVLRKIHALFDGIPDQSNAIMKQR